MNFLIARTDKSASWIPKMPSNSVKPGDTLYLVDVIGEDASNTLEEDLACYSGLNVIREKDYQPTNLKSDLISDLKERLKGDETVIVVGVGLEFLSDKRKTFLKGRQPFLQVKTLSFRVRLKDTEPKNKTSPPQGESTFAGMDDPFADVPELNVPDDVKRANSTPDNTPDKTKQAKPDDKKPEPSPKGKDPDTPKPSEPSSNKVKPYPFLIEGDINEATNEILSYLTKEEQDYVKEKGVGFWISTLLFRYADTKTLTSMFLSRIYIGILDKLVIEYPKLKGLDEEMGKKLLWAMHTCDTHESFNETVKSFWIEVPFALNSENFSIYKDYATYYNHILVELTKNPFFEVD